MNIHRGFLWIAAGALGASAYLYFRKQLTPEDSTQADPPPPGGDGNAEDTTAVDHDEGAKKPSTEVQGDGDSEGPETGSDESAQGSVAHGLPGGERELSEFLGGESWFDEVGWQEIWKREGVVNPSEWLQDAGQRVLTLERRKLADHPALLAGCRRRWIVVSRYADIDVAIAAELWNQTDD
jgi:hypothetical protein